MAARARALITVTRIEESILLLRGQKVLLDSTLAVLYGVETRVLMQAVQRNRSRFPPDFMFQLINQEVADLKSQIVTSSWGGRRKLPHAFTEQGVAMLSSVLNSPQAIRVNIEIVDGGWWLTFRTAGVRPPTRHPFDFRLQKAALAPPPRLD